MTYLGERARDEVRGRHARGARRLAALPFADCRDGMTAITSAPPDGGILVVAGVNAQPVNGAHRPCRPERVHKRVLRVLRHRQEHVHRVSATDGVNALRIALGGPPVPGLDARVAAVGIPLVVIDAKAAGRIPVAARSRFTRRRASSRQASHPGSSWKPERKPAAVSKLRAISAIRGWLASAHSALSVASSAACGSCGRSCSHEVARSNAAAQSTAPARAAMYTAPESRSKAA
jgi:hypothetical protein